LRALFFAYAVARRINRRQNLPITPYTLHAPVMTSRLPSLALVLALSLVLAGCDIAALLADPRVAQREADAKAIGGACRYGMRSIEDCYAMNEKASKAAVFAGWKEMDQYMRDNKVDGVPSKADKAPPEPPKEAAAPEPKPKAKPASDKASDKGSGKPDSKSTDKTTDKSADKAGE